MAESLSHGPNSILKDIQVDHGDWVFLNAFLHNIGHAEGATRALRRFKRLWRHSKTQMVALRALSKRCEEDDRQANSGGCGRLSEAGTRTIPEDQGHDPLQIRDFGTAFLERRLKLALEAEFAMAERLEDFRKQHELTCRQLGELCLAADEVLRFGHALANETFGDLGRAVLKLKDTLPEGQWSALLD